MHTVKCNSLTLGFISLLSHSNGLWGTGQEVPQCDDVVQSAMKRYEAIINGDGNIQASQLPPPPAAVRLGDPLTALLVTVESSDPTLNATLMAGMSEAYVLSVPSSGPATLKAKTTLGALRGLETFAQLVDFTLAVPMVAAVPVNIQDSPRFGWRGLRIDSSRHFLPLKAIFSALDTMASLKLNVLMWHIVDGNSFPLKLDGFEVLAEKGSFCPACVYTKDDVRAVVEFVPHLPPSLHSSTARAVLSVAVF